MGVWDREALGRPGVLLCCRGSAGCSREQHRGQWDTFLPNVRKSLLLDQVTDGMSGCRREEV